MALNNFSLGRDTQLVLMGPAGRIDLMHVTGFESSQCCATINLRKRVNQGEKVF